MSPPDLLRYGIAMPAVQKRQRAPSRGTKPAAKKRAYPEQIVQKAVINRLKLALPPGSFVQCVRNEEKPRSTDPAARMRFFAAKKAQGHNTGFPDLAVILPGGQCVFLELKAGRNDTSEAQDGIHERMRSLGHRVGVAWSADEAVAVLRDMGVPLREQA